MIITAPKGLLSSIKKEELKKAGYVLIECSDPSVIRVVTTEISVDTNDLFMASLFACTTNTPTNKAENFVNELYRRLKSKDK